MVEGDTRIRLRGQIFAFVIAMTAIIGGIVLVALGKSIEGLAALFASLATIIGVFAYDQLRGDTDEGRPASQDG